MISIKEIIVGESCTVDYVSFSGKSFVGDGFKFATIHFKRFANGYQPTDRVIHNVFAVRYLEDAIFFQHKTVQDIFKDIDWRIFTIICFYHTDIVGVGGYTWEDDKFAPLWINGLDPYTYFKDVVYMSCDSKYRNVGF